MARRPLRVKVIHIDEPRLEFGQGLAHVDPKCGLAEAGPFASTFESATKKVDLGLVGLPAEVDPLRRWIERMHRPLLSQETNALRFREFPGAESAFRCRFELSDRFIQRLDEHHYHLLLERPSPERFTGLLRLYADAIKVLFLDHRPDCVLVTFPEAVALLRVTNPRLTYKERLLLERLQQEEEEEQLSLFEPTEDDKRLAAELLPQAEELLFRNFYRALKAECMLELNAVPLQIVRRWTYVPEEAKQSEATRAWNLGLALYYKAANIPWRPRGLPSSVCFVGVSFHHLKRRSGDLVYASVAQAFSTDIEPFALRGASIPRSQARNKQPYLTEDQAVKLMQDVISNYEARVGSRPARVVIHKTSQYQPEEEAGFRRSLLEQVAACDLVWIRPTGFRLLRRGMREPLRGTLCTIENEDHHLFTTGYVPWWREYPGPHIPAPLHIAISNGADLIQRAREILALTKMNWNSAEGIGRHPITLSFARYVGMMMTEMEEDITPNPSYRFYM